MFNSTLVKLIKREAKTATESILSESTGPVAPENAPVAVPEVVQKQESTTPEIRKFANATQLPLKLFRSIIQRTRIHHTESYRDRPSPGSHQNSSPKDWNATMDGLLHSDRYATTTLSLNPTIKHCQSPLPFLEQQSCRLFHPLLLPIPKRLLLLIFQLLLHRHHLLYRAPCIRLFGNSWICPKTGKSWCYERRTNLMLWHQLFPVFVNYCVKNQSESLNL